MIWKAFESILQMVMENMEKWGGIIYCIMISPLSYTVIYYYFS